MGRIANKNNPSNTSARQTWHIVDSEANDCFGGPDKFRDGTRPIAM
jgi:hypothetical protein